MSSLPLNITIVDEIKRSTETGKIKTYLQKNDQAQ